MSTSNFVCGALTGLAAGVIIGILIAPESGDETRRKIKSTAGHWQKRIKRILGKGVDGLSELKYILENEATGLKDDVRQRILRIIDESMDSYDKFKKEALASE